MWTSHIVPFCFIHYVNMYIIFVSSTLVYYTACTDCILFSHQSSIYLHFPHSSYSLLHLFEYFSYIPSICLSNCPLNACFSFLSSPLHHTRSAPYSLRFSDSLMFHPFSIHTSRVSDDV